MASFNQTELIRAAKPADAEAVMGLSSQARKRAYKELIPANRQADFTKALALSLESLARWRNKIQKSVDTPNEYVALVLVRGDKVVGFYAARAIEKQLHVKNLYIDPLLQGQGLGKKLLEAGLQALPYRKAMLHVLAANKNAVDFYKRQGFVVVNEPATPFYGAKRLTMTHEA